MSQIGGAKLAEMDWLVGSRAVGRRAAVWCLSVFCCQVQGRGGKRGVVAAQYQPCDLVVGA